MLNESFNTSSFIDKIRGHVTVELFDAKSGKLVEKLEKHNFIANSGKEYLRSRQRSNFKNQISVLNATADTDVAPVECFNSIALTDSVLTPDPASEWAIPGKLIGWANKSTYSGPDLFRGTPNGTLSTTSTASTKWVFDWPIGAANGTIGSISWGNNVGSTEFISSSSYLSQRSFPGVRPIAYANANLLFGGSGTTVTSYDASMNQITSFTTINCNGIAWDSLNSKLWVISGSQIAAYSQTGTVINPPVTITTRSYRGLTFDGTKLWTTVIADPAIYSFATTGGSYVSTFNVPIETYENALTYWVNSGRDICWDSSTNSLILFMGTYVRNGGYQRMRRYDTSGNEIGVLTSINAWDGSSYQNNYLYNYYNYDSYYATTYYDIIDKDTIICPVYLNVGTNLIYKIRLDGMGSRVLLPSTITKTNAQTLRVTYQMDYS